MNAIPPGGLVPEEPLTRPSAARRGAKPAAAADKVSLMVALEDEAEDGARGAILLEDAEEGQSEPQVVEAETIAADAPINVHGQDPDWNDPMAERQEAGAAHAPEAGGPENPPADRQESRTPPKARPATPQEGPPPAPASRQSAKEAFADEPDAVTGDAIRPQPAAAQGQQARSPGAASRSLDHAPPADEVPAGNHPRQRSPDGEARQEPRQAAESMHRPGSQPQDTERSSPWASGRPTPRDHAASEGWDRPPPPPRHAPRAPSLPAVSLGMPVQLSGIEVTLSVEIGSHRLSLRDLLSVEPGQLVPLDRMTSEPVDILVNGKPFARGEVVAIGDRFGVRLTELVDGSDAG